MLRVSAVISWAFLHRRETVVRQLSRALHQQHLGEDGDGYLAGRLVAQLEPDGRVQPRLRFQHSLVEGVAAGDDHYEVLRTWGQSTQRLLLQIGAAHVRGAREALAPGEVRTVVHDHRAEPRFRSHVRDALADVAGAIEDESRGRPY